MTEIEAGDRRDVESRTADDVCVGPALALVLIAAGLAAAALGAGAVAAGVAVVGLVLYGVSARNLR